MTQRPEMTVARLIDRPDLIVLAGSTPGMSGVPVVIFASAAPKTRTATNLEFVGLMASLRRPTYWVVDPGQTWYAARGIVDQIVTVIRSEMDRLGATEVDTLGNSMGGYGALAFAERLPVRSAISFGSRFSPDARIVPDPRLHAILAPLRDRFPFPTIAPGMAAARHAVVVHGDEGPDQPHVLRFDLPASAEHWIVGTCGHLVGKELRDRDAFQPVLRAALAQDWPAMGDALRGAGARPAAEARPDIQRSLANAVAAQRSLRSRLTKLLRRVAASIQTRTNPQRAIRKGKRHVHDL